MKDKTVRDILCDECCVAGDCERNPAVCKPLHMQLAQLREVFEGEKRDVLGGENKIFTLTEMNRARNDGVMACIDKCK